MENKDIIGSPNVDDPGLFRTNFIIHQTLFGRASGLISLILVSLMLFATGVLVIVKASGGKGYPAVAGMLCLIFFALAIYAVRKSFLRYIDLRGRVPEMTPEEIRKEPAMHTAIRTSEELKNDLLRFGAAALFFWALSVLLFQNLLKTYGILWVLLFILAAALAIFLTAAVVTYVHLLPLTRELEESDESEGQTQNTADP